MCLCAHTFISHLLYSSFDGHIGCFHVFTIVNSTAMNIGTYVHVSSSISVFFFLDIYPRVELVYHMVQVKVLVAQSCLTLCNLMHCSPGGSSVYGIFQARIEEWVAIPFSRGSSQPRDCTQVSCISGRFFTTEPPGKPIHMVVLVSVF